MAAVTFQARLRFDAQRIERPARQLGFWAGVCSAASSAAFGVAAVLAQLGLIPTPWDTMATLLPSLILAPSFVALMVSLAEVAEPARKVWGRLATAMACLYAPLCASAYVVELTVVQPLARSGRADQVAYLTLATYGAYPSTMLTAIDGLGYTFMSLAAIAAAFALDGARLERWLRELLIAIGVLGVPTVLTYFVSPAFLWVASPWAIVLPAAGALSAIHFHRLDSEPTFHEYD